MCSVADAPVPLKLCTDGQRTGPPEVALNNPIELVCEHSAVERLHIGSVSRSERRGEGRHGLLLETYGRFLRSFAEPLPRRFLRRLTM